MREARREVRDRSRRFEDTHRTYGAFHEAEGISRARTYDRPPLR